MPKISCGLLIYRQIHGQTEFFLCHPGGPLYKNKDDGSWSIPKGEVQIGESFEAAAFRETLEETGQKLSGPVIALASINTPRKIYHAWMIKADIDPKSCLSNTFELYGQQYPEIDKYAWYTIEAARKKISPKLLPFLQEGQTKLPLDDNQSHLV